MAAYTDQQKEVLPRILAAKESWKDRLSKIPGVTGVGICLRQAAGQTTDQFAILIACVGSARASVTEALPDDVDGHPIEVLETGEDGFGGDPTLPEADADATRVDPIIGGVQIQAASSTTVGTLGVVAKTSSEEVMLTNSHVVDETVGMKIDQPESKLIGSNICGKVNNAVKANVSYGGSQYYVDAATAKREGYFTRKFKACEITGGVTVAGSAGAVLGEAVSKTGITTGVTQGTVYAVNFDATSSNRLNIVLIKSTTSGGRFSDAGDSGSVILNSSNQVVALLYGSAVGSVSGPVTTGCAVGAVESAMGITFT
ncbi:MAG: S1 family peptidase [Alphaproteobacteria bacterium]|nr:S1 family peptidase [Alphaproteobacteria bacterium]